MKKSNYQPLTCADCDLEFLIPKKQYEPNDYYHCPICGRDRIVTEQDLKPIKPFGAKRKVKPTIFVEE